MSPDEINALLLESARGRFAGSGDAITIGLDLVPEKQRDEVVARVEDNGGSIERLVTGLTRRRLTAARPMLGPPVLVIPRSALF